MTNFNLSVGITEAFWQAKLNGKPFDLIHPKTQQVVRSVSAQALFDQIVEAAWKTGEPGLIFLDAINADNPTPELGSIEATNPCGEVPLLPYEACNLGSINLGKMLQALPDGILAMDWDKLAQTVRVGVHFLENVMVQNHFPLSQIEAMVEGNRKIGLGVMGWADCLIALGIPYASQQAIDLAQDVMSWISYTAKCYSVELAKARGAFPHFAPSRYANKTWLMGKYQGVTSRQVSPKAWQALAQDIQTYGLRHATTTCIAPTGTISMIAGASGGIEPLYALAYQRNVMEGTQLQELHPGLEAALSKANLPIEGILPDVKAHGHLPDSVPESLRVIWATAKDISPLWHLKMQAAFQQFSDNAVSKTINFDEATPPQAIAEAYDLAHALQLKGVTVYRHNSRNAQPMAYGPSLAIDATHQRCPECHQPMVLREGCPQCPQCLYAFCG